MNQKIENYVNMLFQDIPRSKKAVELREEMLSDLNERFEDLVHEGKSENEAYGTAVASLGNVDELLSEVMPSEEFRRTADHYRKRRAIFISIGVSLYILGVVVLIGLSAIGELMWNNADLMGIIGVVVLLLFAAVATGLIIFGSMSTPTEFKDYEETERAKLKELPKDQKKLQGISSIYWLVILFVYLAWSFLSFRWDISWIIWPLAGVAWGIVKTIVELRDSHE